MPGYFFCKYDIRILESWNGNKTWSNENSSVLMNTEYLVHSVGCAHLLTVLWCFQSSPALLKPTEGWIECVTRDLWKFFEKSIFHLWLFAFCFPFPSWKGFIELTVSVPLHSSLCTSLRAGSAEAVSPRCCSVVGMLTQCCCGCSMELEWLQPPHPCHGDCWGQGQEGKQGIECCPLFVSFNWALLFNVFPQPRETVLVQETKILSLETMA